MESNTHNIYLFRALDAYPNNLEETLESLNYALSYDPNNAQALLLMARIYSEQLKDYENAIYYFEAAMSSNMLMAQLYPEYAYTLIRNEDYPQAKRLLDYGMKVKGTDKCMLQLLQGQLFEEIFEYKLAVKAFKTAKKLGKNNDFVSYAQCEIDRVKAKLPKKKKNKKKCKKRKEKKRNRSRKK